MSVDWDKLDLMDWESILAHPGWAVGTGFLMVVATGLLFFATLQLAKAAKRQITFFDRQEKLELKLGYCSHDANERHFRGFTLTNVGVPAVTVTGVAVSLGIPVSDRRSQAIHLGLGWVNEYQGRQISNFKPPHRLLTGDRIEVLYDLHELIRSMAPGQHFRHECWDSFGNTYVTGWVDCSESPRRTSVHASPGEGYREPN